MSLRFGTLSVVVGGKACNANCPYCISRQTGSNGLVDAAGDCEFNGSNLKAACMLAEKCGVTTALITGKGEPTLYPMGISDVLSDLRDYFPIIELQTNAILLGQNGQHSDDYAERLKDWRWRGLKTICMSVVHYHSYKNEEIYCRPGVKYPSLTATIEYLHFMGYSIRLSVVGCKGYIDSVAELRNMIDFCRASKVEQLTWRPVKLVDASADPVTAAATKRYLIPDEHLERIRDWVGESDELTPLMELGFGATVYDVDGQNFCISNCLTESTKPEEQRQLIYFPDGHLRYSWKWQGAILF